MRVKVKLKKLQMVKLRKRRSTRLPKYDYSRQGYYYLTLCTYNRECFFGEITDDRMQLNEYGKIADKCWGRIPEHFPYVMLDEYIIMPNHIHGLINITRDAVGAKDFSPLQRIGLPGTSKTIGSIVRGFKIGVTKWIRQNTDIINVWQRSFHDHIVRTSNKSLYDIRKYIIDNPKKWDTDENNINNFELKKPNAAVGAKDFSPLQRPLTSEVF